MQASPVTGPQDAGTAAPDAEEEGQVASEAFTDAPAPLTDSDMLIKMATFFMKLAHNAAQGWCPPSMMVSISCFWPDCTDPCTRTPASASSLFLHRRLCAHDGHCACCGLCPGHVVSRLRA